MVLKLGSPYIKFNMPFLPNYYLLEVLVDSRENDSAGEQCALNPYLEIVSQKPSLLQVTVRKTWTSTVDRGRWTKAV